MVRRQRNLEKTAGSGLEGIVLLITGTTADHGPGKSSFLLSGSGFEGRHLWKSVDVEKGARGSNVPATPQMESSGLYSTEVGKVQGKSLISSQKQKSPELTSAHPSDMVTTPQGAHNLRRQDILGRLEFLGNKFTGLT